MWRAKNSEKHSVEQADIQRADIGGVPVECLQRFVAKENAELLMGLDIDGSPQEGHSSVLPFLVVADAACERILMEV